MSTLWVAGFGSDLAEDHPGFHDDVYKRRRAWISSLAREHRVSSGPIPRVEYTPEEVATWTHVLSKLKDLFPDHACQQYLSSFPYFNFQGDQLEDISQVLKSRTNWQVRPVAGLLHPRDFLAGLAFKCFHSTQYLRHHSQPSYTPEPDLCHELIGHMPMLANQGYADLVQAIGEASLGADDKMVWHLTKVYWYTVEFGLIREGRDHIKAFGAGVLSSYGELKHIASGAPDLLPFDPFQKLPKMSYKDGYQKAYFILDSFEDAEQKLRALARAMKDPVQPFSL
ncbi:aromatic amino acid hydroxylase [Dunaliella salina]|uniref:phenylalanine 4-monooxygenase n=1 Tax=Dunaliella salina TaxID=3046 RepID=A0ABQ7H6K6_DUNSA|nr:aromatic amino acid hydroxylase [Dunaliella salina]|eukprot:KAF5842433.1 aromatic amino acid hydroxylase [Dunaliella salina]